MLKFLKNIVPFAAAAGCLLLAGGCSRTMYPQGQHRRDLQPPTDAVLCYGGSHHRTPFLWDKERLAPYVTYVDKEGTEHWLFDGSSSWNSRTRTAPTQNSTPSRRGICVTRANRPAKRNGRS